MRWLHLLCLLSMSPLVNSATVSFSLTDNQGQPLKQAVFMLTPTSPEARQTAAALVAKPTEMAQQGKQFIPHILPVQKGAEVVFSNRDDIKHHVYSLSEAKQFDHIVDENSMEVSETFDRPGEVNLGCNLHDWMLSFIYVVDTPYFMVTDEAGQASLNVPSDEAYLWRVWHPRITDDPKTLSAVITVTSDMPVTLALTSELLPDYQESGDVDEFDDY